ncbi:hypothetical protein B0H34DRAFT_677174 [Crassisporium funariophilum]|nr:hypothetical protein B0H34DRAFT_677174 [Crassisporium funariophilum]
MCPNAIDKTTDRTGFVPDYDDVPRFLDTKNTAIALQGLESKHNTIHHIIHVVHLVLEPNKIDVPTKLMSSGSASAPLMSLGLVVLGGGFGPDDMIENWEAELQNEIGLTQGARDLQSRQALLIRMCEGAQEVIAQPNEALEVSIRGTQQGEHRCKQVLDRPLAIQTYQGQHEPIDAMEERVQTFLCIRISKSGQGP